MGLLNNFKVRMVRLPVKHYFHFGYMHIRSLNNTSLIHLCSGQGSDPYCFFPVNPFVDETDLSFEKKKIFMPIKHHFGKSEWLKIN